MKQQPTAVHLPPISYLSTIEPETLPDPRLGLILSNITVREVTPAEPIELLEYAHLPPPYSTDYLSRLNERNTRCEASAILDEKNHHIKAHSTYVAYCKTIAKSYPAYVAQCEADGTAPYADFEPRTIEAWHELRDTQRPTTRPPYDKLINPKPKRPSYFSVMFHVPVGVKDSASCDPNKSFKTKLIPRVFTVAEDTTGYYGIWSIVRRLRNGQKIKVSLSSINPQMGKGFASMGGLYGAALYPNTKNSEKEPACLKRVEPRPVTWDQHVARASYRHTISTHGVTRQLGAVAKTQSTHWRKAMDVLLAVRKAFYLKTAQALHDADMRRLVLVDDAKLMAGHRLALVDCPQYWPMEGQHWHPPSVTRAQKQEQQRLARVANFERDLKICDRVRKTTEHKEAWVGSFGESLHDLLGSFRLKCRSFSLRPQQERTTLPIVYMSASDLQKLSTHGGFEYTFLPTYNAPAISTDYLPIPRCKHPMQRSFLFFDGKSITMCPDCDRTKFDEQRASVLRVENIFQPTPCSISQSGAAFDLGKDGNGNPIKPFYDLVLEEFGLTMYAGFSHDLSYKGSSQQFTRFEEWLYGAEDRPRKGNPSEIGTDERSSSALSVDNRLLNKQRPERRKAKTKGACWYCRKTLKGRKGTKFCSKLCCNKAAERRKRIKKLEAICQ